MYKTLRNVFKELRAAFSCDEENQKLFPTVPIIDFKTVKI